MLLQVGEIVGFAGGVDHQEELVVGPAGNDQVIENAAGLLGQHAVSLFEYRQGRQVHRHQLLQRRGHLGPADPHLPHVRHIEQPGLFPGMQVLLEHARGKLHRHGVPGKTHQFATQLPVQVI